MKVQEFINEINKKNSNLSIDQKISKVLIVNEYIPIDKKKEIIQNIIKDSVLYNNGLYFDEIELYLNFSMNVLYSCTNLEKEDVHADYDLLCSNMLFDVVMNKIDGEYSCFKILLEMEKGTILNQDSLDNSINNKINDFLTKIIKSFNIMNDEISKLDFNKEDLKELIKIIR